MIAWVALALAAGWWVLLIALLSLSWRAVRKPTFVPDLLRRLAPKPRPLTTKVESNG